MEALQALNNSLELQWTPEGLLHACEAIITYLSSPHHTKKILYLIWTIAQKISIKIKDQNPLPYQSLFEKASGSYLFQLKFYKLLQLPANIQILSNLVRKSIESKLFKESKIPKFDFSQQNNVNPLELGENAAAAIFLLNSAPVAPLLQNFISIYLNDKAIKPNLREFMILYKPMLAQITTQQFGDELLGLVKRIIIRAVALLPEVTMMISYLSCDMSPFIWEIFSPTLLEYLYNEKYFSEALELFKALAKKSQDLTEFQNKLVGLRDLNESQVFSLLSALSSIPTSQLPNPEPLVNYTIAMANRVKKEAFKKSVADCISNLNPQPTPQLIQYLQSNLQNAAFANLLSNYIRKYDLKIDVNYPNVSSSLILAMALSIKIPQPCPVPMQNFLNDKGSSLYLLQNLSADESLAIARAIRNGLEIFTDSETLCNKFAAFTLSKFGNVRKFCHENWPRSPAALICRGIISCAIDEILVDNYCNSFKQIITKLITSIKTPEDAYAIAELLSTDGLYSIKRTSFVISKYHSAFNSFDPARVFSCKRIAGFALTVGNFEEIIDYGISKIQFEKFKIHREKREFVEGSYDNPHFNEVPKLLQICEEMLNKAGIKGDPRNTQLVEKAFGVVWNQMAADVTAILNGFAVGVKLRNKLAPAPEFFDRLYRQVLPTVYELYQINDVSGPIWHFVDTLLSSSKTFSRIASQFTTAFLRSSLDITSDKALNKIFSFVDANISISKLNLDEAYLLEKIVIYVLRQLGTSLRSAALSMMIEFLYAKNFFSLEDSILQICHVLQTYSSPLINSIFPPLIPLLKPHHWEPLFDILLLLEPLTKQVLLDYLLQYEDTIPNEKWSVSTIYLSLFDDVDTVSSCSQEIWDKFNFKLTLDIFLDNILVCIYHDNVDIQSMAAKGTAKAIEGNEDWKAPAMHRAFEEFNKRNDNREGIIKLLNQCVGILPKALIIETIEFILDKGMEDPTDHFRSGLLETGILYLNTRGEAYVNEIFTLLQLRIDSPHESTRHSAVVMLGFLAKFFGPEDFRIESTIELLLKSLDIPSDMLASTVSKCLPRLASYRPHLLEQLIDREVKKIFDKKPIKQKRGAGYGLASLIKGGGIKTLISYHILDIFENIINNKKAPTLDKGAILIAIEGLCSVLGRSFEPYFGEVLPFILDCFSDKELQEQANNAARVLMSKLSANGMKKILPLLTRGLQETKWKSKVGAIEALGKLAFCSWRQLALCLPDVVPQVVKAFSDTNPNVLDAARTAITDIGSVITNPEIFQIVPILTKALGDISALSEVYKVLIDTAFHHYMDAPSLSLLIPLIETGLKSRSIELKKQACQIVGGITKIVADPMEIFPYLERIVTSLKYSLFDALPEVRNIAAQNLGALCNGIGEELAQPIVDWLQDIMQNNNPNVERSGAVHAYSEIILYNDYWEQILPELLKKCNDDSPLIRESYLGVFIFIPPNTQGKFERYLNKALPIFLKNLSHENEDVRKIAVRVVQLLIQDYGRTNMESFFVPLEEGLFQQNWRTRQSCITLMGEMLDKMEALGRREGKQLISHEIKNRILASVYILRSDHSGTIHVNAVSIWKSLVENTPKFLLTLTPELVLRVVQICDKDVAEPREIAGTSVQGLISKYQGKLFSSYLRHFEMYFDKYPKGVAFALRIVCESATRNLLITYSDNIIQILEHLLHSNDKDFLENAGGIFHDLYNKTTSVDNKDPGALSLLDKVVVYPAACRELLKFKNEGITKALLPKIMSSEHRSRTLPEIANLIADDLFNIRELNDIFTQIINGGDSLLNATKIIIASLSDHSNLESALNKLEYPVQSILHIVDYFCSHTKLNFTGYVDKLLTLILPALLVNEPETIAFLPEVLKKTIASIPKEELCFYFPIFKSHLTNATRIQLFNEPKGLDPFLPILQSAIMYGSPEIKEMASRGYCDIIQLTDEAPLLPYAVNIAGPLIRVLSERVPGDVKVGILDALYLLLQKSPAKLKTFVTQLQSVFVKSMSHTEKNVRDAGHRNLIELLKLKPRVDLLVSDLCGLDGPEEIVVQGLQTLQEVAKRTEIPSQSKTSAANKMMNDLKENTARSVTYEAGKLLGLIAPHPPTILESLPNHEAGLHVAESMLSELPEENLLQAEGYFDELINSNYTEALGLLTNLSKIHPKATFMVSMRHFDLFANNLAPALPLLISLPSEEFSANIDALSELLPAIAKACKAGSDPNIDQAIINIFSISKKKIDNVLKALHLLDQGPDQVFFRQYAERLIQG